MEKIKGGGKMLAALYRKLLYENGIKPSKLEEIISEHAQKVKRNSSSGFNIGSYKGNLKKELLTDKLTWNSFIKGIKVLNPLKVVFTVTIRFRNSETIHSVELDLTDNGKKPDEDS